MQTVDAAPETIPEALARAAGLFGVDEALVDGSTRLSFGDLREKVGLVARALIASGIAAGDRVALWAPNSADWVVISFAVYSVGAVLVPLNTRYKGEEAGHVLRTSGARLLFTVTDFLGSDLPALLGGVSGLRALEQTVIMTGPTTAGTVALADFMDRAAAVPPEDVQARGAAIQGTDTSDIIFTSGTTGRPKGAVLGHGASVETYIAWSDLVGLHRVAGLLAVREPAELRFRR